MELSLVRKKIGKVTPIKSTLTLEDGWFGVKNSEGTFGYPSFDALGKYWKFPAQTLTGTFKYKGNSHSRNKDGLYEIKLAITSTGCVRAKIEDDDTWSQSLDYFLKYWKQVDSIDNIEQYLDLSRVTVKLQATPSNLLSGVHEVFIEREYNGVIRIHNDDIDSSYYNYNMFTEYWKPVEQVIRGTFNYMGNVESFEPDEACYLKVSIGADGEIEVFYKGVIYYTNLNCFLTIWKEVGEMHDSKLTEDTLINIHQLGKPSDAVESPAHYNNGSIETIDYLESTLTEEEFEGFCKGNILKYVSREGFKNGTEDLKKAQYYLNKLIEVRDGVVR